MVSYGYIREFSEPMECILNRLTALLEREGLDKFNETEAAWKIKEILKVDIKRYVIMDICNPPSFVNALEIDGNIGLMLPVRIIVYENKDGGTTAGCILPTVLLACTKNDDFRETALFLERKLKTVIDSI